MGKRVQRAVRILTTSAALSLCGGGALGQTYQVAINQAGSAATYSLNVTAPMVGTPSLPSGAPIPVGSSYLIGGAAATPATTPPTRTRPSTAVFGTSFTGNFPVAITSGSISATGSNGGSPVHPSGGMTLVVNPAANAAVISGLSVDLLGGATAGFTVSLSIAFQSFHTRDPNSILLIPGATIPVTQQATVTSLVAAQPAAGGAAVGTLTPTGTPGVFAFSVPVTVEVTVSATLAGAPVPVDPQTVEVTLAGTVDTTQGATAPITATITINDQQTQDGPIALDPQTIDEPIYGGKLLATLVLQSVTVGLNANATIAALGTRVDEPADPLDVNGDGIVDPDDLADFIAGYFSSPPGPGSDFNGDGVVDPDDLSDYIAGYFGR